MENNSKRWKELETGDSECSEERNDEVKGDGNHGQPHPVTTGMPRGEQIVPRFGFMRETADLFLSLEKDCCVVTITFVKKCPHCDSVWTGLVKLCPIKSPDWG